MGEFWEGGRERGVGRDFYILLTIPLVGISLLVFPFSFSFFSGGEVLFVFLLLLFALFLFFLFFFFFSASFLFLMKTTSDSSPERFRKTVGRDPQRP